MSKIHLKTEIPGPKSVALMARRKASVARGPFHSTPIFIQKAKGPLIEDVDGNTLIDFASGIGVTNVGHCPETLVGAIQNQATRYLHAGFNVTPYEGYVQLAEKLNALAPGTSAKKTLLINSGAEAVENAIKIARAYTGRSGVICFDHGFHGRTYMAMTLTSKVKPYKLGFGPFNPEIYRAPFPYEYRWPTSQCVNEAFDAFENLALNQVGTSNLAAVILEPVLGEGGFVPIPKAYFEKLRKFCTEHKVVLIADEIQSGFGRTGHLFACGAYGIEPDLITLAKGLAGGLPLSAVVGRAEIMDAPIEGGVGGTYGGNPVACASALAVLEEFQKEGQALLKNAQAVGEILEKRLNGWKEKFPIVGDSRGLGAMRGLEIVKSKSTKEPNREATVKLSEYAYKHGVVTLSAGTFGNIIRLLMPLSIDKATLEEGLDVLEKGFHEISSLA